MIWLRSLMLEYGKEFESAAGGTSKAAEMIATTN
jgi:hypothetical protein